MGAIGVDSIRVGELLFLIGIAGMLVSSVFLIVLGKQGKKAASGVRGLKAGGIFREKSY